ncbi:MAG: hypothetical protein LBM96_06000 [Methanobrevibacter sp.]|jgi:hypothetical protein|nr:hypothetical protein [Candidatus Methanoflexus mossambicus]
MVYHELAQYYCAKSFPFLSQIFEINTNYCILGNNFEPENMILRVKFAKSIRININANKWLLEYINIKQEINNKNIEQFHLYLFLTKHNSLKFCNLELIIDVKNSEKQSYLQTKELFINKIKQKLSEFQDIPIELTLTL